VKTPTVSIILPTYNRFEYLPDTIASIFAQTYEDWELLIADDGSDSATITYLDAQADQSRVRLMSLPHTGRPAVVRNAALQEARGKYIAFMDSDDLWMPTKLEVQIRALQGGDTDGWCHTQFVLVDSAGHRRSMMAADGRILNPLLEGSTVIALPSVMVSRKLLDSVGGFDESLIMCEDYDLWLRLAAVTRIIAIHEPLTIVRRHSQHYGNPRIALGDGLRVLDKAMKSPLPMDSLRRARTTHARHSVLLARHLAGTGRPLEALSRLVESAPAGWRHYCWWRIGFGAIVLACVPNRALELRRKYRSRRTSTALQ